MNEITNPSKVPEDLSNLTFIAKSIIWIAWIVTIFGVTVLFYFAYNKDLKQDHWGIDSVVIGVLATLLPFSLVLRFFVINKIKNLWLKIPTYLLGVFFSELIIFCGYFAAMRADFILIIVGAFMILLYFPACIRIQNSKM